MSTTPSPVDDIVTQLEHLHGRIADISKRGLGMLAVSRELQPIFVGYEQLAAYAAHVGAPMELQQKIASRHQRARLSFEELSRKHDAYVEASVGRIYGQPVRESKKTNLGSVSFCEYLPEHKPDGTHPLVALKRSALHTSSPENPIAESAMLRLVNTDVHRGMLRWVRDHRLSRAFYTTTEFCEGGDFFTFLTRVAPTMEDPGLLAKFKDLCYTIDYLHNGLFIAHRDLKPENILVGDDGGLKLCDMGLGIVAEIMPAEDCPANAQHPLYEEMMAKTTLAREILEQPDGDIDALLDRFPRLPLPPEGAPTSPTAAAAADSILSQCLGAHCDAEQVSALLPDSTTLRIWAVEGIVGTHPYMAPEVLQGRHYNPFCADIYSLGVILFIMATGFQPYRKVSDRAYAELRTGGVAHLLRLYGLLDKVPAPVVELISLMMHFSESERPSIKQVIAIVKNNITQLSQ